MKITRGDLRSIIKEMVLKEEKYTSHTHSQVVAAVDRALEILDISNSSLRTLMIRIARTESGGNPEGLDTITHHDYDPFQLDFSAVEAVQKNINMRRWREFVDTKQGPRPAAMDELIADQTLGEIECNRTLGALFATLYVLWGLGAEGDGSSWYPGRSFSVPSTLEDQAAFWKKRYNTIAGAGKVQDFIDKNS